MMKTAALYLSSALVCLLAAPAARGETVTLLHFSDYHSHALPFYSERLRDQGGIARAIHYLRAQKREPNTYVFSGGDTLNKGAPAWSDKYRCVEWPWLNGVVDAAAYGNHDADYGEAEFARCRAAAAYPILGANVSTGAGTRLFDVKGRPYLILTTRGRSRIGVFALAGSDFKSLLKPEQLPVAGVRFDDRIAAARDVVRQLREREKVSAVVLIGHAHREEDEALARAVPAIDVIFGTHSHIKAELRRIEGTSTWYVSPSHYLTYVSRVRLQLADGRVAGVTGGLVRIGAPMPEDRELDKRVKQLQRDLERDPEFAPLFQRIGTAPSSLDLEDSLATQTPLGRFVMETVREAAGADLALSTASSFRQPIAAGPITLEDLRASLPYPNKILVYAVRGSELRALLALVESKKGTDSYAQLAGVNSDAVDDNRQYQIATIDFLTRVPGYREYFAGRSGRDTGLEVRDQVARRIKRSW